MRFLDVGDRVILIDLNKIMIGKLNPLWGSEYQSIGTVIKIYPHADEDDIDDWWNIRVEWDNGSANSYNDSHLTLYKPIPTNILPEELFEL
jgi:hypothetical protein